MTDKARHQMVAIGKPALNQVYTDPAFGTKIRRVTDVAAQFSGARVAKPAYSTVPAWNADESLLILYIQGKGHALFDGRTYQYLRMLPINPADIEHFYWSATQPDILFYPTGSQLIRFHVSSGVKDVVYSGSNLNFGSDPVYGSFNNDVFGFPNFTWRLSNGVKSKTAGSVPQVSPSGRYFLAAAKVHDAAGNALRAQKGDAAEHGSMVRLANGQDAWASIQFDGTVGTVVTENLDTGALQTVVGPSTGYPYPPSGTHMSGMAFKAPGYLAVSVVGNVSGQNVLDQELLLVNLATNVASRIGHHRSFGKNGQLGYWAEPHVNVSPSGKRVLFGSDWGGGSTVDTYVVELP